MDNYARYYEFIFGFLTAREQNKLANKFYFSPVDASKTGAVLEIMLGIGTVYFFHFIGALIALDGIIRYSWVITHDEPIGFIPIEILDRLILRRIDKKIDNSDPL